VLDVSSWLFPALQTVHIVGLTILVGTIALVDFRLLGFGVRHQTVSQLARQLAPWTAGGLVLVGITGPLLFGSDLARYLKNPAFLVKMILLGLALIDHYTIHRYFTTNRDSRPVQATHKLAATLSLILWSSVVLAGRAIADFDLRES
jgi:hypothetical protein